MNAVKCLPSGMEWDGMVAFQASHTVFFVPRGTDLAWWTLCVVSLSGGVSVNCLYIRRPPRLVVILCAGNLAMTQSNRGVNR